MKKRKDQFMLAVLIPLIIMLGLLGVVITIRTTSQTTEMRSRAGSNERILKEWTFNDNTMQGWVAKGFTKTPTVVRGLTQLYLPTTLPVPYPYIQHATSIIIPPTGITTLVMRLGLAPQPRVSPIPVKKPSDAGMMPQNNFLRLEYKLKYKTTYEKPVDVLLNFQSPMQEFVFTLPAITPSTDLSKLAIGRSAGSIIESIKISMAISNTYPAIATVDWIRLVNTPLTTPTPVSSVPPKCTSPDGKQFVWNRDGTVILENGQPIICKQGDTAICRSIGTKSEGWYSAMTGGKIIWEACGSSPSPTYPPPLPSPVAYCDSTTPCPNGYVCITPAPCPIGPDGKPTACAFRPYCKANPTPSISQPPPLTCTTGWQCGSACADTKTMEMFNGTWCDGKARWLYEAGKNLGLNCGGSESTLRSAGCGTTPTPTYPPPPPPQPQTN